MGANTTNPRSRFVKQEEGQRDKVLETEKERRNIVREASSLLKFRIHRHMVLVAVTSKHAGSTNGKEQLLTTFTSSSQRACFLFKLCHPEIKHSNGRIA